MGKIERQELGSNLKGELDGYKSHLSDDAYYATKDGAKGDGVTPNAVAINTAIANIKANASQEINGAKHHLKTLRLPKGDFIVEDTITLQNLYGFTVEGEGRKQTRLIFTGVAKDLFYINKAGYITFKNMSIVGTIDNDCSAIHEHMVAAEDEGKPVYQIYFDNVEFLTWYKVINITGDEMCEANSFKKCRFLNNYIDFEVNNYQSLGHNFFACDFESYYLADFTTKPVKDSMIFNVISGGTINVYGGFVLSRGTTIYINPSKAGDLLRYGNAKYNFHGTRWEMLDNVPENVLFRSNGLYQVDNHLNINFIGCIVYQRAGVEGNYIGYLWNNAYIHILDCNFYANAKIKATVDATTQDAAGTLIVENSNGVLYEEERLTANIGINHHIKWENGVWNTGIGGQRDFEIVPRRDVIKTLKRTYYQGVTGILPANGASISITIPRNAQVIRGIVKRGAAGGSDTIYTFKNADETVTYGSVTIPPAGGFGYADLGEIETTADTVIKVVVTGSTSVPTGYFAIEYF